MSLHQFITIPGKNKTKQNPKIINSKAKLSGTHPVLSVPGCALLNTK